MALTVNSDSWQLGVDKYLASIPTKYRKAFVAPASPEECIHLISLAQTRSRKFDRVSNALRPLVEPLKRFEATIDVLVQTYSSVASPIWGPLKMLIHVLHDRIETLCSIMSMLEKLVEPLQRFQNYEVMFQSHIGLRHAVGSLYCDILEFFSRVIVHQSGGVLSKNFGNFDKDIADISYKIHHHWTEVDVAANAAGLAEAKIARRADEIHRNFEIQRDINQWLNPSTVEDDLEIQKSLYMTGSCDWLRKTPEVTSTVSAMNSQTLIIEGLPGVGKSIAAAFLIDGLKNETADPVLFFFCKATSSDKSFSISALRTFVWQLLQYDETLYRHFAATYIRSGRRVADSLAVISTLLKLALERTIFARISIVVDAIDECIDVGTFAQALSMVKEIKQCSIATIITTRHDPKVSAALDFADKQIELRCHQESMQKYIAIRVAELSLPIDEFARNDISKKVNATSNGVWLFAQLLLDELGDAPTIDEIDRQISSIPEGLAQLYTTIIQGKEKRISKIHMKMAQLLFLWLDTSTFVPESLWKIIPGDVLDHEMVDEIWKFAMRSNSEVFNPMKLVQDLCSPLVRTRLLHETQVFPGAEAQSHHTTMFAAEFFHQTGKHYLKWCEDAARTEIPVSLVPRRMAALNRGACACWYLSESRSFQDGLSQLRERPRSGYFECFIEMASGLWEALKLNQYRWDLDLAEIHEAEDNCDMLSDFFSSDKCLAFVEASVILHFAERSPLLLQNIADCLEKLSSSKFSIDRAPPSLRRLAEVRRALMKDFEWAIRSQCPENVLTNDPDFKVPERPVDFERRPVSRKILALVRKYRYLLLTPGACSVNSFLLGGRS